LLAVWVESDERRVALARTVPGRGDIIRV
jgi:hypothetical protein